ncbi:MAG: hypothetical protein SynsKO_13360 [Synoicihabitans sp.]
MNLSHPRHDLFIPDGQPTDHAISRTTHLGIGAHQDDLEFMALHGILACFQKSDRWFAGITCTDGASSSRSGPYADFTNEQMMAVRIREQKTAASIGQFGFIAQLGHHSSVAKNPAQRSAMVDDIKVILEASRPDVIYTHNPFDKHPTHVGVMLATMAAIHALPHDLRPQQVFGCEVWRGLDWLPDAEKSVHDVSGHANLAASLNGVFDSQIAGGKRYDLAVEGRRLANATFFDAHSVDETDRVQYAVDLSSLISGERSLRDFMTDKLASLNQEIFGTLAQLTD